MGDEENQNVKVMTRVRLFNKREMEISERKKERMQSVVRMRGKTCAIMEYYTDERGFSQEKEREAFEFDECFWSMPLEQGVSSMPFATQQFVYERSGALALKASLAGFNVCIFAYGQTGSGKTYSMLGAPTDPGISPRLVDDMFSFQHPPTVKMTVECMFFEIYNEKCRDLFNKKKSSGDYDAPKIRQHPTKGVFVEGLTRKEVNNAETTKNLIERGTMQRAMTETKMNAHSSRSHAVFQIQVTQADAMKGTQKVATINLVDLAGSEKIKMSGVTGDALTEAKNINQSLSILRKVIDVLIDNSNVKNKKNRKLPPYRESVLTYVLSDSLGGNSKTQMIAAISPHEANIEDTIGTLRYALRAKAIVCDAKVNEEKSAAMMDSMRDEILLLQQKLRDGSGGSGGAPSAEIQQEIEMREQEVKQMEEQQHQMEDLLEEAKAKEIEMEEKLKEVDEAKAELQLNVESQKKEQFAAAFRNAFLITSEKKKQEEAQVEFEAMKLKARGLEEQNSYLQAELANKVVMYDELRNASETRIEALSKDIAQRDTLVTQLKRQVANSMEENRFLKDQNQSLQQRVHSLESLKIELEKRVQRMQEELLAAQGQISRERSTNEELQTQRDEERAQFSADLENMRKRKDKYKLMYMEARAKSEAAQSVIDALHGDRTSFVATIKAQQQVVQEQSTAVKRIFSERKETEVKSRRIEKQLGQKEEDMRLMNEALKEYQHASTEFIYENHTLSREIERLRTSSPANGGVGGAAFSPSPVRRGTSPTGRSRRNSVGGSNKQYSDPQVGAGEQSMSPPHHHHHGSTGRHHSGSITRR